MRKRVKLVRGIGINDANYHVHKTGSTLCHYYDTWSGMLRRAYNDEYKKKYPTYEGVTVCEEWHSFMNFRSWMVEQDWNGKHLDKDILVKGNKIYSPDTCVFVDAVVNIFITDSAAARGEYPIGVSWHKRDCVFQGYCNNPFTKKIEHLGYFDCPNQAHLAWKTRKHELSCQLADLQKDERVANALRTRYN